MDTQLHADRTRTVLVRGPQLPWVPSPEPGVERRLLERLGGEIALATSIVRYRPGSSFPRHVHDGGEEYLVLEGTFSDETGDHPRGTYVRNPPGSSHTPFSRDGCVIFVKLRQMLADERESVCVTPADRAWRAHQHAGIERALLYSSARSRVELLRFSPGARLPERRVPGGEEILILQGEVETPDEPAVLDASSWRRSAAAEQPPLTSRGGAMLWVKQGHL